MRIIVITQAMHVLLSIDMRIIVITQAIEMCLPLSHTLSRLTIISCEAKKKQQPLSELFTWNTNKKHGNALAKLL